MAGTQNFGKRGDYQWMLLRNCSLDPRQKIVEHFSRSYLAIAAFDSGPITCSDEELQNGWRQCGTAILTPPLSSNIEIPSDTNDEWYVFSTAPISLVPQYLYVGINGFTLADPDALRAAQDPTWCRNAHDWLYPVQAHFWADIDRYKPDAYILLGDDTLIVTNNTSFLKSCAEL